MNGKPQQEKLDFTENKIQIDKIEPNIIRELTKLTNSDMKEKPPLKFFKWQNNLMQINKANYVREKG